MSFPDRRTTDVLLTVAFFVLVCAIIYSARHILLIFVFAMFFAYLINPIVKFMQAHSLFFRNLRGPAVVEVYIALVVLTAALGYAFAPRIATNTAKLVDEVPVVLDGMATGDIATQLATEYGWSEATKFRFKTFLIRHRDNIQGSAAMVDRFLVNTAHVIGYVFLIPILAIFFLREGDHIAKTLIQVLFPADRRAQACAAAHELHIVLAKYMSAQVLLCTLSFVFYLATLLAVRCPHAVALAVLGGFLEFIPVAGWLTTFAAVVSVATVSHTHWIWIAVLFALWRVLQDYLFCPRIMGRHLRIHPLAAVFAILVGAEVGGIVGVYLAIPVMASVRVIWQICAARETIAAESRPRPAATTGFPTSPTPRPVAYVEAIPALAKAD
jgi:predicted PurR-regulated permease PerM